MAERPSQADRAPAAAAADECITLTNARGLRARLIPWGATLVGLEVPDRDGSPADVVLGFDEPTRYRGAHPYFGSTVGRYANRIARGRFTLVGVEHALATNEGRNHLHGGPRGFSRLLWKAEPPQRHGEQAVAFRHHSPDGEEGYPGSLDVRVCYTLTNDDVLRIEYAASADAPTVVNLTHHSYFNLADGGRGDILGHALLLAADRFAPVDAEQIPTGELLPAPGTAMDFTSPRPLGAAVAEIPGGVDHSYALASGGELAFAARISEPSSGRVMEVYTTEPALQVYTGNHLDGSLVGKNGARYRRYAGVCLEAQRFPDAPNQPTFPSAVLEPGEPYRQMTEYRFGAARVGLACR